MQEKLRRRLGVTSPTGKELEQLLQGITTKGSPKPVRATIDYTLNVNLIIADDTQVVSSFAVICHWCGSLGLNTVENAPTFSRELYHC